MNPVLAKNLRSARARIDTPEKWTQGANARNESGDNCDTSDYRACRFCMKGAVYVTAPHMEYVRSDSAESMLELLSMSIRSEKIEANLSGAVTLFNDHTKRTHADVMRVFDRAITLAEAV